MSIADLMQQLADAGAPIDAIILAVRAIEAKDEQIETRKAAARDRKRRQRERERDSHAQVTGQSQDIPVTPSQDKSFPDTPSKTQPSQSPPIGPPLASKRGSRLPIDFEMPDDWKAWAKAERHWSDADVETEAAAFIDHFHAKPGKDGVSLDWKARWRNWARSSRRQSNGARAPATDLDVLMESVERKYANAPPLSVPMGPH